jgi:hypothetical protein
MADNILTQNQAKDLLDYHDGVLYCKVSRSNLKTGAKVGSLHLKGYLRTQINKKMYYNHRIIFLMFHGWMPAKIDHIDNNPFNNKIDNLRPATNVENGQNAKKRMDNTSGVKGVYWSKRDKKWQVRVQINGKRKSFGYYDSIELADLVAQEARTKYHGQYARHF